LTHLAIPGQVEVDLEKLGLNSSKKDIVAYNLVDVNLLDRIE